MLTIRGCHGLQKQLQYTCIELQCPNGPESRLGVRLHVKPLSDYQSSAHQLCIKAQRRYARVKAGCGVACPVASPGRCALLTDSCVRTGSYYYHVITDNCVAGQAVEALRPHGLTLQNFCQLRDLEIVNLTVIVITDSCMGSAGGGGIATSWPDPTKLCQH